MGPIGPTDPLGTPPPLPGAASQQGAPPGQPGAVPLPAAPSAAGSSGAWTQLVSQALQSLNVIANQDLAASLLPAGLPPTAAAVRQLLSLFASRGTLPEDLHALTGLLQQAAEGGALPLAQQQAFATLAGQFAAGEAREFLALLRQLNSGKTLEARLALALQAGQPEAVLQNLQQELRAVLSQLQGREALLAYFQAKGVLRSFQRASQRVLERLTGADLQNLRGLEQRYVFWELPFPPESPLRHAQVHLFQEGGKGRKGSSSNEATIVFDLDTTQLGPLWIALQLHPARCQCTIRATSEAARNALQEDAQELINALEQAGYANARIQTLPWDGDRLRAAAELVARFRGITLEA